MKAQKNEIRLKTTINKEDYKSIVYFNIFTRAKIRTIIFILISIIVLLELLLHFIGIRRVEGFELYLDYFVAIVVILVPIEVEFISRRMAQADKSILRLEQDIIINDEGIECKNVNSKSNYQWPLVCKAYESKRYFLIFANIKQMVIIPKRDLESLEIEQLRKMLKDKILSKNKLKK